jgi:RDD family
MLKHRTNKLLNKASSLQEVNLDNEIPIITVGNGFVGLKKDDLPEYASVFKRFLAKAIDLFVILFIFIILSGFVSSFIISTIPKNSQDFLITQFNRTDISLEQTEKLLNCDVDSDKKNICKDTLPYLGWINFYNIITLLIIHVTYFIVLTKVKFNSIGRKILRIKVHSLNQKQISWVQSLARESIWILLYIFLAISYLFPNIATLVGILSWFQITNLIIILTRSNKMGVHDSIAQTIVLKN